MALPCKPNIEPSKTFVAWKEKRLTSTLGAKPQAIAVNHMARHPPSQTGSEMKDLIATVKVVAETLGTVGERPTQTSKAKQTTLSKSRVWRLAGLC